MWAAGPPALRPIPKKNEIYVVNSGSANLSVIDAEHNALAGTIGVQNAPYFIDISPDGRRGYVANSGSNNVSVIDLEQRRVIANIRVGTSPGLARVSPDGADGRGQQSRRRFGVVHRYPQTLSARNHSSLPRTDRHCDPARQQQGVCSVFRVGASGFH